MTPRASRAGMLLLALLSQACPQNKEAVTVDTRDVQLQQFQDTGSLDSLIRYVREKGESEEGYRKAGELLQPVLGKLSFGEHPTYDELDWRALQQHRVQAEKIFGWMAGSGKADLRTAGLELMGRSGWANLVSAVEQHTRAPAGWERLAAVRALGRLGGAQAQRRLREMANDPDAEVKAAVGAALQ